MLVGMSCIPSVPDIATGLRRRGILYVCHMTPCDRLPSIFSAGGLLSLAARRERGVAEPPRPHDWGEGKREALARYAICAFKMPKWMLQKHPEEMALILLDARPVCCGEGVLFCPGNSAAEKFPVDEILGMTGMERFDDCFKTPEDDPKPNDPKPFSEILVPGRIPVDIFRGLIFCDQEALDFWQPVVNEVFPSPSITVTTRGLWGFGFPLNWHPAERVRP